MITRVDEGAPEREAKAASGARVEVGIVDEGVALADPVAARRQPRCPIDRPCTGDRSGRSLQEREVDDEDADPRSLSGAEARVQIVFLDLGVVEVLDDVDDARDVARAKRLRVG